MIDKMIPVQSFYQEIYQDKLNNGLQFISDKKIAIVGLCRNAESYIDNTIQTIVDLFSNKCKDYMIILFENDSKDDTVAKITNICNQNNKIKLISQTFNRPHFGPVKDKNRTIALAEYRNILKNYVKENLVDFDFTIVIDTDFSSLTKTGIYNSFGWLKDHSNISAICGNSFEFRTVFGPSDGKDLWNYDCWAFRGTWWNDWQAHKLTEYQNYNPMAWFGFWILPPGSPPIRINSGFGGCCIYRTSIFITGEYSGIDCEHVTFHYDLHQKNPNFNLYLNPSQIMLVN